VDYLISVSHSDFKRYRGNMDKVVEICSISGFPGIEGYHTLFEGLDNSELEEAGENLRENGVKTPSFHLPLKMSLNVPGNSGLQLL
jgi:sugar phosphate isomerase/epimerase